MKFRIRALCALFAVLLAASMASGIRAADPGDLTNRFNIVFVNDESGSMTTSDSEKLRYRAIELFVSLMANTGNRLGSVSFNHEILKKNTQDLVPCDKTDRQFVRDFKETVFSAKQSGTTNIGLALKTAVEMLEDDRDKSLPSNIILLTDGKTEMRGSEELQLSLDQKADAIEACRESGYHIYTICLGGGEHEKELEQIASATGGEYALVKKPEDLADVQKMFYGIIFKALSEEPKSVTTDENGYAEQSFNVPRIGVEELNVIIEGKASGYGLRAPNGRSFTSEELDACTEMNDGDRIVLKVTDPAGGMWTAEARGEPGITVSIQPLFNASYRVIAGQNTPYKRIGREIVIEAGIGDEITLTATVEVKGAPVLDPADYEGFTGVLYLTEDGETSAKSMTLGPLGFEYTYEVKDEGTFYARVGVERNGVITEAEDRYILRVNNTDPEPPEEEPKAHANVWPIFGGKASIDLTGAATDRDKGDEITYSVVSSAFNEEDYTLEDNVLTVRHFSISKGSFRIRATDSRGGYCEFDAKFTSTNIGILMLIAIGAGGLIVLAALIGVFYHNFGVPFMGTIIVEKRDPRDYSYLTPISQQPGRGRVYLESFGFGTVGLPPKSYFQAGGRKNCIYFIAKKPVYASNSFKPSKKIRIDGNGAPVILSMSEAKNVGVSVIFRGMLARRY